MAGEKTTKNNRIKETSKSDEGTVTMTKSELQDMLTQVTKTVLSESGSSVPKEQRTEIESNMRQNISKRINDRTKRGQVFNENMAASNKKMRISIDKVYKQYAGKEITATVNGNTVKVPVDGKPHWVHPAHYAAIKDKLRYLSDVRDRANEESQIFDGPGDFQKING